MKVMMAEMMGKIKKKGSVLAIQSLPCVWGNYLASSEMKMGKMVDYEGGSDDNLMVKARNRRREK